MPNESTQRRSMEHDIDQMGKEHVPIERETTKNEKGEIVKSNHYAKSVETRVKSAPKTAYR